MKRFILLALASMLVLSVGGFAVPAGATHPGASHLGMDLEFNSPNSTGATNSDLAFWGSYAYAGNYNGFRIFDISTDPPTLVTDYPCDGPQNDVSVWDRDGNGQADILFMSVDSVMEGPACGAARHLPPVAPFHPGDWEGIRIFDVSNPLAPVELPPIYQDCGSHTHTLVPDPANNRVLLYNASYSLRSGPSCGPGNPAGRDPVHGVIQVSQVKWDGSDPLNNALLSAVEIAEPPISYPGDPDNVFTPAHHGAPGFNPLRACHDIGVLMGVDQHGNPTNKGGLVAGACAEQAQLWRLDPVTLLPDTANPLWVFDNPEDTDGPGGGDAAADFWHSATFTWDGKIVNFSDESFGEGCPPTTLITDPAASVTGESDTGRTYFIKVKDGKLQSDFMIPRPDDSAGSYCSTHQGNTVATKGHHYFLIQAWYTGGVDVIDFHDPKKPKEVAYFDFDGAGASGSDNWAHYWYETDSGQIIKKEALTTYGHDGVHTPASGRGFEVFEVTEKGVMKHKRYTVDHLNPQTQEYVLK